MTNLKKGTAVKQAMSSVRRLLLSDMLISPSADDPTHIFTVFLIFQLSEIDHHKSIPHQRRKWRSAYAASQPEAFPAAPVRQG